MTWHQSEADKGLLTLELAGNKWRYRGSEDMSQGRERVNRLISALGSGTG